MKLNVARVLSKQGKIDETLEILGEYDGTEDLKERKLIGFILYKIGQHEMAYEYLKNILTDSSDLELFCAVGIVAVQVGIERLISLPLLNSHASPFFRKMTYNRDNL